MGLPPCPRVAEAQSLEGEFHLVGFFLSVAVDFPKVEVLFLWSFIDLLHRRNEGVPLQESTRGGFRRSPRTTGFPGPWDNAWRGLPLEPAGANPP